MSVLISGSIALDHVKTPHDEHENLLGGSASYAAIASAFFAPVNLCGVVGHDFPQPHIDLFNRHKVDLGGVEFSEGETFRWSGEYFEDMNSRETLDVALNVLEEWQPAVPDHFKSSQVILLANAHPENQHSILDQVGDSSSAFTIADTMDLWITIARDRLHELMQRIDLLVINDSEAKQLMETSNLITAGHRMLELGPRFVIIKKGEHGALLFGEHRFFSCGAYPLKQVFDPTGAGDSFVGAMAGYLCGLGKEAFDFDDLANATARGTIIAGYTCESFSTHRLQELSQDEFRTRLDEFRQYSRFD